MVNPRRRCCYSLHRFGYLSPIVTFIYVDLVTGVVVIPGVVLCCITLLIWKFIIVLYVDFAIYVLEVLFIHLFVVLRHVVMVRDLPYLRSTRCSPIRCSRLRCSIVDSPLPRSRLHYDIR